jgi:hypothetical protein
LIFGCNANILHSINSANTNYYCEAFRSTGFTSMPSNAWFTLPLLGAAGFVAYGGLHDLLLIESRANILVASPVLSLVQAVFRKRKGAREMKGLTLSQSMPRSLCRSWRTRVRARAGSTAPSASSTRPLHGVLCTLFSHFSMQGRAAEIYG